MHAAFLILAALSASVIFWPTRDFMHQLPQGDWGRDLYAFQRTALGEAPYQDYFWNYGPIAPYYYALFLKLFGDAIPSVLLGGIVLKIFSGFLFYSCLALFFDLPFAFLGAVWFWSFNPNFVHTSNHLIGIFGILLALYFILKYIRNPEKKWVYLSLSGILTAFFVKYNIGLSTLVAAAASVFIIDTIRSQGSLLKRILNLWPFVLVSAAAATGYALMFQGISSYSLRLCSPILSEQKNFDMPALVVRLATLFMYIRENFYGSFTRSYHDLSFSEGWVPAVAGMFIVWTAAFISYWLRAKENVSLSKKEAVLAFTAVSFFSLFSLHEFLLSPINYRIFWATPALCLLGFFAGGLILKKMPVYLRAVILLFLCLTAALAIQKEYILKKRAVEFAPFFYLDHEKASLYVCNSMDWIGTVQNAVDYLNSHLAENEKFLAVPYEPLYYYLLGRKSPVFETCFFESFPTPKEREIQMIEDLEREKINHVLLSNRNASEGEFGMFGERHYPLLGAYLSAHFEGVAAFGNWDKTADWTDNHAVRIYKRKK